MVQRSGKKKRLNSVAKALSFFALLFVAIGISLQAYTSLSPKEVVVQKKPKKEVEKEEKKEIEVIGAVREEADFISEEQWTLYDKARTYAGCFVQDPGSLGGQEGSSSLTTKEIGGYTI